LRISNNQTKQIIKKPSNLIISSATSTNFNRKIHQNHNKISQTLALIKKKKSHHKKL